jgi:lipoprotein-anchoring transpeptidase ErfK/SrfK
MGKLVLALTSGASLFLLGSIAPPPRADNPLQSPGPVEGPIAHAAVAPSAPVAMEPAPPPPPEPDPPPTPQEALEGGVLIVVSLASQKMFVFRDGELWETARVSTGKRGKETPTGVFPILQKKIHHRSTLYDDAPMPFMQRLTWDGVALHAGRVPGYPASHGCIRLPRSLAKKLYGITGFSSTAVIVTQERLASAADAQELV